MWCGHRRNATVSSPVRFAAVAGRVWLAFGGHYQQDTVRLPERTADESNDNKTLEAWSCFENIFFQRMCPLHEVWRTDASLVQHDTVSRRQTNASAQKCCGAVAIEDDNPLTPLSAENNFFFFWLE